MTTHDPRALRNAFGSFLTGVTVVTTFDGDGSPLGFTANSFTSVSLDPPLLLVCLAKTSRNYDAVTTAPGFAINILAETQKEVSNTFARPVADRFATVDWRRGPWGSPIISEVAAWFDCALHEVIDAGDHAVLIGRVEAFGDGAANGLGYARGAYFTPSTLGQAVSAATQGEALVGAVVEQTGAVLLLGPDGGPFTIPECPIADASDTQGLQDFLLRTTGLVTSVGFVYSVYQDRSTGRHHIVYSCTAETGLPSEGRFIPVRELPMDQVASVPTRDVLRRFAGESALGNFSVYVGTEQSGRVHPIGRKV